MVDAIRVLLVDDDPADADLARLRLQESRLRRLLVQHAETAGDAAALLRDASFDVVLLDLSLLTVIREFASIMREGLAGTVGAANYFTKPLVFGDLLAELLKYVDVLATAALQHLVPGDIS